MEGNDINYFSMQPYVHSLMVLLTGATASVNFWQCCCSFLGGNEIPRISGNNYQNQQKQRELVSNTAKNGKHEAKNDAKNGKQHSKV